jgi:hypothetical protein
MHPNASAVPHITGKVYQPDTYQHQSIRFRATE